MRNDRMTPQRVYRNEWKYACAQAALAGLESRLAGVLARDVHAGQDGRYRVRSLYFDDLTNACAADTLAGLSVRYKYRIRYYDDRPEALHLERKEKLDGGCHKESCPLTGEEYAALVRGDAAALLYDTQKPLLRRFCADMLRRGFTPRLIVDYERIAFAEPIANVRVTLDTCISVSPEHGRFLAGDYRRVPLMPKDQHILEVKFDAVLPGYVRRVLGGCGLQQQSFSKYVQGLALLRRYQ